MKRQLHLKVRLLQQKEKKMAFSFAFTLKEIVEEMLVEVGIEPGSGSRFALFIPPTEKNTSGLWYEDLTLVAKNTALMEHENIELKNAPCQVFVTYAETLANSMTQARLLNERKPFKFDFHDPLSEIFPVIERALNIKKGKDEFSFQHYLIRKEDTPIVTHLHSGLSLHEQLVAPGGLIVLFPLSALQKTFANRIQKPDKEGWLNKWSVKDGKDTPLKKRWTVLKDNFLYYFKNQTDSFPSGVIALEYCTIAKLEDSKRKFCFGLNKTVQSFSQDNFIYKFETESETLLTEWIRMISYKSVVGAPKRVFGVPLQQVVRRKYCTTGIPPPFQNCIKALDTEENLALQGIFRISGSAVQIEKLKDEFDKGVDVDMTCVDPHTASGLLKLYLRELPEPLITFNLFNEFIGLKDLDAELMMEKAKELVQQLPVPNRKVLFHLLEFLGKVNERCSVNLMSASNLATVFGPNLLKQSNEDSLSTTMLSSAVNYCAEILITHYSAIFVGVSFDEKPILLETKSSVSVDNFVSVGRSNKPNFIRNTSPNFPRMAPNSPTSTPASASASSLSSPSNTSSSALVHSLPPPPPSLQVPVTNWQNDLSVQQMLSKVEALELRVTELDKQLQREIDERVKLEELVKLLQSQTNQYI